MVCMFHILCGTGPGVDSASPRLGLGLDLVSNPQSLGLVSVSIYSGLGHDSVLV